MSRKSHRSVRAVAARSAVLAATAFLLTLSVPSASPAVCGDVTGDDDVTTSDALTVLKEAVGQNPPMTCEDDLVVDNDVGLGNLLHCYDHEFTAKMHWSEHPDLEWRAETEHYLPLEPDYIEVDDLFIGGVIDVHMADCGTVEFDLDDWGIVYPMPAIGAAFIYLDYEWETDTIFLFVHLAPLAVDDDDHHDFAKGGAAGAPAGGTRVLLGSRPAPKGISRAVPK